MSDTLSFDDSFYPVSPAAVDADPAQAIEGLLDRVARLEHTVREERLQAQADMRAVLLDLIGLSDEVTSAVERWGVATNAREAAVARMLVTLGRTLLGVLKRYQVEAVETIGKPFDPQTSDMIGREERPRMEEGLVLRETQIGYAWPQGVLRRAQVIVSARPERPQEKASADERGGTEAERPTAQGREDSPNNAGSEASS